MSRFGEPKVSGSMNTHTVVKCKQFLGTVRVSDIKAVGADILSGLCVYVCGEFINNSSIYSTSDKTMLHQIRTNSFKGDNFDQER